MKLALGYGVLLLSSLGIAARIADQTETPAGTDLNTRKFLFVGGARFSGTSVARQLLVAMPSSRGQDSCLDATPPCHPTVEGDSFEGLPRTMQRRRGIALTKLNATNADAIWAVWRKYWDLSDSSAWLVEKSPSNMLRLPFLEASFQRAAKTRAVIMIKSPVANSQTEAAARAMIAVISRDNSSDVMKQLMFTQRSGIRFWIASYALFSRSLKDLDSMEVISVRFEELVSAAHRCAMCITIALAASDGGPLDLAAARAVCFNAGPCSDPPARSIRQSRRKTLMYHGDVRVSPKIAQVEDRAESWSKLIDALSENQLAGLREMEPWANACGGYSIFAPLVRRPLRRFGDTSELFAGASRPCAAYPGLLLGPPGDSRGGASRQPPRKNSS
jgi:hypothetical protein